MQTVTINALAAGTTRLDIGGKYFTTLSCNNPINVRFYHGGKKLDLGDITGLLAGLEVSFPNEGFDRIEVDATAADTIQVGIGNGQARYNRSQGNVAVTNTVNVLNTNPIANPAIIVNKGDNYGASYKSITNLAANTPETVFTPAANVNGAIIHSAAFTSAGTGNIAASLVAKASAPANLIDGDVILSSDNFNANNTTTLQSASLKNPIKIPAGKGLYYINNLLEITALRNVLYTLL